MMPTAPAWAAYAAALIDRELARSVADDEFMTAPAGPSVARSDGPRAARAGAGAGAAGRVAANGGAAAGAAGSTAEEVRRGAAALDAAERALDAAEAALDAELGEDGPLALIATVAELDPTELRLLALCAAVETDRTLQRLVGMLRADARATRIDIDLVGRLLGSGAIAALADDGRLARAALLELDPAEAFAAAIITVPRRVTWALFGDRSLDPHLPPGTERLDAAPATIGGPDLVLVAGPDRVRRVQAAVHMLGAFGYLLCPQPADETQWRAVVRQAGVTGWAVIIDGDEPPDALARRWIERADHVRFALLTRERLPMTAIPQRPFSEVPAADPEVSDAEWQAVFPGTELPARRPTAQQLQWAAHARRPGQHAAEVVHRVASGALLKHATRITPAVSWSDLVLPAESAAQLRHLADRYRDRDIVHGAWNLPRYPSPGVVALFAGPSGTGKSTAAEVIAGDLGLDMFRVDLSALVSKYIGETEKNLEEIFSAATAGDYVLLFDEADALFGARSKVSDARDRYANMEVSYLLQRLETYDGFVILTSNFQGNIDPAFLRRIHVAVPFAVPTEADRLLIWQRSLAGAPQQDLDLSAVAKRFDLTGGSIRMSALSAAYLAASRGHAIGMAELMEAITAEMTKLRRRTGESQMGPAVSAGVVR